MKKIQSLQGLRAVAFIFILISHCGINFGGFGEWGVSVFFILSGFLMSYNYVGKIKILMGLLNLHGIK